MIRPKEDRVNYGQQLHAPAGYHVLCAIATTYGLDLETLLTACIALGLNEDTDSALRNSPLNDLHSIHQLSKKLVVFCEGGQMVVPTKNSPLMGLLDKQIVEVKLSSSKKHNIYPAFHPKVWIIAYKNDEGKVLVRLIVMSRNLTTDRSWDVSVTMEGYVGKSVQERMSPLVEFVEFLNTQIKDKDEKPHISAIMRDLKRLLPYVKMQVQEPFDDFELIPLTKAKHGRFYEDMLWSEKSRDKLIISPFLSTVPIAHWNSFGGGTKVLITRTSELGKIVNCHDKLDVYTLKDTIVFGEQNLSTLDSNDVRIEDIHAKLYLWAQTGKGTWVYIGSMNASERGLNTNCEFMAALHHSGVGITTRTVLNDLMGKDEKDNPFEKVDWERVVVEEEEKDETDDLQQKIKAICRLKMQANVEKYNENYRIILDVQQEIPEGNITIRPFLQNNNEQGLQQRVVFEGLNLIQLSELYVLTVKGEESQLSRIIKIPTSYIPVEREDTVIENIVDSPNKLALYIGLVLAGDDNFRQGQMLGHLLKETGHAKPANAFMPALYEQLLKASVDHQEQIEEIGYLIDHIGNSDVVSEEMRRTVDLFRSKKGGQRC